MAKRDGLYGLMAEFDSSEELLRAAQSARDAGYVRMDAYTPTEVHGLDTALGLAPSRLPRYVLGAGLTGALLGYGLQFYSSVLDYPWNIGGRPDHSWPAFIIVTFELTILLAGVTAAVGMIMLCRLPRPYHPVFNVPQFERASQDRFFLCIESSDKRFHRETTSAFLEQLHSRGVYEVRP